MCILVPNQKDIIKSFGRHIPTHLSGVCALGILPRNLLGIPIKKSQLKKKSDFPLM